MKRRLISIIVLVNIIVIVAFLFQNISYGADIKQSLSTDCNSIDENKYPGIKSKINELKKRYPNWNFKILYTGIQWEDVIKNEYTGHEGSPRNLVPINSKYAGYWICPLCQDKVFDSGSWKCASEDAIKYMMDPRNSLNTSDVFQFLELSYDNSVSYSKDIIKNMLKGSFLQDEKYATIIIDACKKYNVNPYYIVARILQEQKKEGTTLTKGQGYNGKYIGYYNVFNIGATGSGVEKVILNGLAKAEKNGWSSLEKSIYGGIEIIAKKYIALGQNTMYLQKFDVDNSDGNLYWHQYMQNILAAQNEGTTLRKTISSINALESNYNFIIPVYENMPKNPASRPATNINTENISNKNENTNAISNNITTQISNRIKGDVNCDGKVTSSDYVLIKNHIMNTKQLTEEAKKYADYNEDGKITSSDYVLIKNYIMSK